MRRSITCSPRSDTRVAARGNKVANTYPTGVTSAIIYTVNVNHKYGIGVCDDLDGKLDPYNKIYRRYGL